MFDEFEQGSGSDEQTPTATTSDREKILPKSNGEEVNDVASKFITQGGTQFFVQKLDAGAEIPLVSLRVFIGSRN